MDDYGNDHDTGETTGLEIAIVGLAGRFPGAPDVDAFWQNLRDGVESVTRYTDAELRERGVPEHLLADPDYVKAGVPFAGADLFDAEFFGYTPRDAQQLDPQHRIFLECAWAALEHAGCDPQRYRGRVGVYAGSGASVYLLRQLLPNHRLDDGGNIADLLGLLSGNMADALCTRVAYKLNLRGPAVTVQTACSTSLMAVHAAGQALLGHECDLALAGGVSLNLLQNGGYRYQAGAIFSPDGHCRAFDADAAGTLLGSGAGIVALKRLEDARRDGDTIHAIILGSAANNDGADKVGFTAPSVSGQAAAIRAAQGMAGIAPDTVGYIEAHGTGTTLGDPVELAALTQVFRAGTGRTGFCAIGSVKTNVGHLDAAAGVTGLIKTVLALKHRTLPPSLHFRRPNPQIDFDNSPFYVNTAARPWPAGETPRRAGVSAFGIGGTNVHVVLQEAPTQAAGETPGWQVLPLSARNAAALEQAGRRLADSIASAPAALADIAQTLQLGRRAFAVRRAVVADSHALAAENLRLEAGPVRAPAQPPEVAFLFPGGGVQHANMGRALYDTEPVFRQQLDRCCELLRVELGLDLRELLYPAAGAEAAADAALATMRFAQPALFVFGYALAQAWLARGVRPATMLGHSLGEYVAACLAGVFELEDALRIVAARGRLLHSLPPGAMAAVPLAEAELAPLLAAGCDLAAVNGERLCVLSGPLAAIEAAERFLREQGVTANRLHIAVASHSAMTEPVLAELERVIAAAPRQAPRLAFISSVTGKPIAPEQATDPAYWAQHLRRTVRFADGLNELARVPRAVLEVGPGEALTALARQHPLGASALGVWPSQAHPQQPAASPQRLAQAIAGLWCAGVEIDWAACHPGRAARRVPLPAYAFQRDSYWAEAKPQRALAGGETAGGPFYATAWRRAAPTREAGEPVRGVTLVLGGEGGLADALIERLGHGAIRVEAGAGYERLAPDFYRLRPAEAADHAAMLRDIAQAHGRVGAAFWLWSAGGTDGLAEAAVLECGFHGLHAFIQALEKAAVAGDGRLSLLVAASEAEDVTGQEPLNAARAALFPLCKVIAQEYPQIDCRFVDVIAPAAPPARALLARQLVEEARSRHGHDAAVAWRGPNRWLKHFDALTLDATAAPRLRHGGTYLITGGLGGVGLALARHLAHHWQARLVLLGRTAMPAHEHWSRLAADANQSAALRQPLRQLLALEATGAQLMTLAADVADETQMRAALAQARQRFGAIHGVVHAAGANDSGLLGAKTRAEVERVFAPKLRGAQLLLALFADAPLDFLLLCSSIASVTGGLGKGGYAAANACLDAIALEASRRLPYPVLSVDWDAWRDLGMAAGMTIPEGIGWSGPEGARVFETIVNAAAGAPAQVVISTTALQQRLRALEGSLFEAFEEAPPTGAGRQHHPRPALKVAFAAPADALQQALAALWSDVLGIAPVGVDDNLFELGGDSLVAIQLLSRVKKIHGVEIHPSRFFRTPTIAALSALMAGGEAAPAAVAAPTATQLARIARGEAMAPSPMQQRLWIVDRLADAAARTAYNMAAALELRGAVDAAAVRCAIDAIVARHEVLRMVFAEDDNGDPVAVVDDRLRIDVPLIEVAGADTRERDEAVARLRATLACEPFDLAAGPLLRARLLRLDANHHLLLLVVHHIVFDGWSVSVFAREFGELYRARRAGEMPKLPALPVQYADYAAWHHRLLDGPAARVAADFWRDYLRGCPTLSTFRADFPRPAVASLRGGSFTLDLDAGEAAALQRFARERGASLFTLLIAAFLLVLHHEAGADDVVVGTDVAGRLHPDLENLLGFFVNVIPLRSRREGGESFEQWLARVAAGVLSAMDHQHVPFDRIVDLVEVARTRERNPLVQVLFVLQNTPDIRFEVPGVEVAVLAEAETHSKFDLAVFVKEKDVQGTNVGEDGAGLAVEWVFATDLFRAATVQRLAASWRTLLREAMRAPATTVEALLAAASTDTAPRTAASAKLDKLNRLVAAKTAARAPEATAGMAPLAAGRAMPLVITAPDEKLDPAAWAQANRALVERLLLKHAAILFRGFGLGSPREFEAFAEAIEPTLYGDYGDLPKKEGGRNIYRSTPYPERQMILYHNESSHLERWPRKQLFFCELPSPVGGATPIVDGREMLRRLPVELVERFERLGLLYVRTFVPRLDVSWQDFFKTDSRAGLQARLDAAGIGWRWLDERTLQTRSRCPAVITHPLSGERVFFNQLQLHHVSCLEAEVREDLLALVGEEGMPRQVYFGDGSPIDERTIDIVGRAYEACAVRFDWRKGDVVLLDNMLAAHARDPYEEPRRIVVAMGDLYDHAMLAAAGSGAARRSEA